MHYATPISTAVPSGMPGIKPGLISGTAGKATAAGAARHRVTVSTQRRSHRAGVERSLSENYVNSRLDHSNTLRRAHTCGYSR